MTETKSITANSSIHVGPDLSPDPKHISLLATQLKAGAKGESYSTRELVRQAIEIWECSVRECWLDAEFAAERIRTSEEREEQNAKLGIGKNVKFPLDLEYFLKNVYEKGQRTSRRVAVFLNFIQSGEFESVVKTISEREKDTFWNEIRPGELNDSNLLNDFPKIRRPEDYRVLNTLFAKWLSDYKTQTTRKAAKKKWKIAP